MISEFLFYTSESRKFNSIALLILRVVSGLAFILHGWGKIQNPFNWMGPDSSMPGLLQFLAAFSEFGGGIAWVIGLLTPLASLGLFFTMLVTVYFHMILFGDPFVANAPGMGSYEPAAVYLAISFMLIIFGAGKYSLDALISNKIKNQ